jgi:hypothetical protein
MRDRVKIDRWPLLVVGLLLAIQLAAAIAWLLRVRYPFAPFHLSWSYSYARTFNEEGLASMLARWAMDDYYPPLNVTLWAFLHHLFGPSRFSIPIGNALFWLPGLFAVYSLAKRATGVVWPGLLACALTMAAPHIAFYFRVPSYEIPMAAMQMVFLWGIAASERFFRIGPLLAAAAAFAAGMLMKWTFIAGAFGIIVFAAADTIYFGYRRVKLRTGPFLARKQIIFALIAAGAAMALAAPWYFLVLSWNKIASNWPTDPTQGDLLAQSTWYLAALYRVILSAPLTMAFLFLLPAFLLGKNRNFVVALLSAFFGAYVILSIIPHKEIRYGTVLVPLCALAIAIGLENLAGLFGKPVRIGAIFLGASLLAGAAYQTGVMSFQKNVFPLESGDLSETRLDCMNDLDGIMGRLEKSLEKYSERHSVRVAVHPLSPLTMSFSSDVISHYLGLISVKKKIRYEMIGFANFQYEEFAARLREADVLLVPQEVWDMTSSDLEQALRDMSYYTRPGQEPPPVPENDPLYKERISLHYTETDEIPAKCVKPVHVYLQNGLP